MKLTDEWFTAIAESEVGNDTIFVSGRCDIDEFIQSGKFRERAEVTWRYQPDAKGMPAEDVAQLMEEVMAVLKRAMEKNKLAILTGVYTGAGERNMIFYTRNIPAFGNTLNEALASFELLPLLIYSEKDPEWSEYAEMCQLRSDDVDDMLDDEE
ncbi:MAG: DUF695 domain-containing protein [Bacteroidaceae bacterium]|nr:DUF695 domain-containing protein [Bacteroidaceae bacterium]